MTAPPGRFSGVVFAGDALVLGTDPGQSRAKPAMFANRSVAGPVYTRAPLPMARAGVVGPTLETGAEHVIRAAVEAMAYQNRDNVEALVASGVPIPELKVRVFEPTMAEERREELSAGWRDAVRSVLPE